MPGHPYELLLEHVRRSIAARRIGKTLRATRIQDDEYYPTGCYVYSEASNNISRAVYFNTNTNNRRKIGKVIIIIIIIIVCQQLLTSITRYYNNRY